MGWKRAGIEAFVSACSGLAPRADAPPKQPKSILVLRNNDIGDLLVITPLFEALSRLFPEAKVVAGIGDWNREVLAGNPYVTEVIPINAPWHNKQVYGSGIRAGLRYVYQSAEARALSSMRFEIGIDVLGSPLGALLLMRASIPWRMGVSGYAGGHTGVQQSISYDSREHVGRSALRFAELLGATDLPENRPALFLDKAPTRGGHIVIAPGGGFAAKCWPATEFAALATLLRPLPVVVIGGKDDLDKGSQIATAGTHVENLCGKLNLREAFHAIASSQAVICNSSMAMHAAAAFKKPCCVLLTDVFASASEHAVQWAYPETLVLGPERGRRCAFTAAEAYESMISQDFFN